MKCAAVVLVASVVAAASGQETEIGKCQNIAFAPKFQSGTGPITPCEVDDTCSTACCSGNLCRNPLALSGGATCGNGFAPSFSGFPCESLEEALQQRNFLKPPSAAPDNEFPDAISFTVPSCQNTQFAPANGPGERFTTAECQFDSQCSSNCCDSKRCRVPQALTSGQEFCRNGFTPVFSGTPCANEEEAIGEVLESRDVDEPVENEEDELAYEVPDCANAKYQPNETGDLLYTAECTEDNECSTGCCELNAKICVEISGLAQGEEFCSNGFTPVYEGTPCAAEVDAIGDPIVNEEGSNLGLILGVGAVAVVAVGFVLFRRGKEPQQQQPPSAVTSSNPYARSY